MAYVGALGNTWKESEDRGVYKTTDAGGGWCSLELSGLGKRYFGNFGSQDRTFGRARGWGNVAKTQRSHDAHSVLSCFFYSDLTEATTCWSPHISSTGARSSRNRSCFNQIFYTAISTSWTLERGPCRKPSGGGSDRYSLSQKALRLISEYSSTGTSFWLSQSGGLSGASDSWLETIKKRAKQAVPSINSSCMRLANFLQPECFGRLHVGRFKSWRRLYSGVEV